MPIQVSHNPKSYLAFKQNVENEQPSAHAKKHEKKQHCEEPNLLSKGQKIGIFATTMLGVGSVMAAVLSKKGFSLSKIFSSSPKNWGIFKAKYEEDEVPKLVTKLALGSVAAGLLGGAIFDKKENMKAKIREAVIQLVGNIFTPLACVWGGMKLFKKVEEPMQKLMPTIKNSAGELSKVGKAVKGLPGAICSAVCLISGILLGNKVGNTLNEKIFHVNDNRKLKLSDMSPHIDDLCIAVSLVGGEGVVGDVLKRIIPAALLVAGYSVGTAPEKKERLAQAECSKQADCTQEVVNK